MTTLAAQAPAALATAVYLRISDDKEGREAGVERQRADCLAAVERLGWRVAEVYVDNDRSASEYASTTREGYRAMRAAVLAGRARAVVAWSGDRLHRRVDELDAWMRLTRDLDVPTYLVNGGTLDVRSAAGKMHARMSGTFAAYESDVRSERVTRAMQQLATEGRWRGAPAFGWTFVEVEKSPGRVVRRFTGQRDPVAAPMVAEASRGVLAGESLSGIARRWNASGVLTLTGKQWNPTTVKQVLTRAANAGLVERRGEVVGRGQWAPLVDEDTWRAVRARLSDPARKTTSARSDRWLGAGVYHCGVCGGRVRSATASSGGRTYPVYRCRTGVSHVHRVAEPLDAMVTEAVLGLLEKPENLVAPARDEDEAAAREALAALRTRLDEAADDYAEGRLTREQLVRITERLRERIEAAEARLVPDLAVAVLEGLGGPGVRAQWERLPIARRRRVVDALLEVTVNRSTRGGKGFDPTSVTIRRRQR
jgi:DNA invertase Pin-like site-specific DNA recombinase